MSSSSSTSYMHAAVAFNKAPGTLSLQSDQTVRWVPSSATSGISAFHIHFSDIAGLQTSKAGAATIALMLVLANGVQIAAKPKVLLVFNAAQQTALDDREKFKTELAAAVGRNKASADLASADPSVAASPAAAVTSSPVSATRAATPDTRGATPTATRPASASAGASPAPAAKRPRAKERPPAKTDIELRISVIKSNAQLRALHKDIVISGQMADAEFWAHPQRQRLLRAERAKLEQRAGRNARLADPKPTPNEAGEMKLSITPELIRDLFEQFPVVARAYEENVPTKLDEGSFWTRYFQSKLYHRLRTSARSAASEHIVQDDAVFDQYLTEEDNQLEPRRQFNPHDRLLDLQATEEDHGETGNEKDWTMRAGAERRTLPLMRRFNDHSQSLLDSALGDQEDEQRKRRRIVGGVGEEYDESTRPPTHTGQGEPEEDEEAEREAVDWIKRHYYDEIVIDELTETRRDETVRLNMAGLEGYLSGGGDSGGLGSSRMDGPSRRETFEVVPEDVAEYVRCVGGFNAQVQRGGIELGSFRTSAAGGEKAMSRMLANLGSRALNPKAAADLKTLPDAVQKSLISLQASTTEFLRQFWNAIAPGANDTDEKHGWNARTQQTSTADMESEQEARTAVAVKMAANLKRVTAKVEDLLATATTGIDQQLEDKVIALLTPTQRAVDRALAIARARAFIS